MFLTRETRGISYTVSMTLRLNKIQLLLPAMLQLNIYPESGKKKKKKSHMKSQIFIQSFKKYSVSTGWCFMTGKLPISKQKNMELTSATMD